MANIREKRSLCYPVPPMTGRERPAPEQLPVERYDFSRYSKGFQEMVAKYGERELLRGSHFDGSFADWEAQRRTAAGFITEPGTVLDFGCANGFLLACLREWTALGEKLEPYGIDTDTERIAEARKIFSDDHGDHFLFPGNVAEKLPERLNYVYWNVWDNADLEHEQSQELVARLRERANGGRLIVGLYHAEEEENLRKLEALKKLGITFSDVQRIENGHLFAATPAPEKKS